MGKSSQQNFVAENNCVKPCCKPRFFAFEIEHQLIPIIVVVQPPPPLLTQLLSLLMSLAKKNRLFVCAII